jgi:hypothetical protein
MTVKKVLKEILNTCDRGHIRVDPQAADSQQLRSKRFGRFDGAILWHRALA